MAFSRHVFSFRGVLRIRYVLRIRRPSLAINGVRCAGVELGLWDVEKFSVLRGQRTEISPTTDIDVEEDYLRTWDFPCWTCFRKKGLRKGRLVGKYCRKIHRKCNS